MRTQVTCCMLFVLLPSQFLCSIDSVPSANRNVNNADKLLYIPQEYIKFQANNTLYTDRVERFRNSSVDTKCEQGMDFGVTFHISSPYVTRAKDNDNSSLTLSGIFPHVLIELMKYCCPRSKITYGKSINSTIQLYEQFHQPKDILDISFPLSANGGNKRTRDFRGLPFIPITIAPTIVLLVPNRILQERNTRTKVLMTTIFNTWPMLIFIIVSAMLSGLILWSLDRKKNSKEFPLNFFSGGWEGIWWAFVTMTTVGYGDRSPQSLYARAFCIIWILLGIILISLFTGLVSASLNVSSTPVFNIAGATVGAVRGSVEYQVGVGYNADMKSYEQMSDMLKDLVENRKLEAILVDNFILTTHQKTLKDYRLRIERKIKHPVTNGIVLSKNSTETERCFRQFNRLYAQKVFEIISDKLQPVKNPTDDVRVEVEAAEKLFYEESLFKIILCTETGLLVVALIFGTMWEVHVMNEDSGAYRFLSRFRRAVPFEDTTVQDSKDSRSDTHLEDTAVSSSREMQTLLTEYDEYHNTWVARVKNMHSGTEAWEAFR